MCRSRGVSGATTVLVYLSLASAASAHPVSSTSTTAGTTSASPSAPFEPEPSTYAVTVRDRRAKLAASDLSFSFDPRHASGPGQTGADLLSRAPGVLITQHSGEGKAHQIFLRGFDAVHGQDVEINVGGIPVNEPSNVHGQGYADLHFLIAESVLRLHVLEGPFAAKQGDFAVAGSFDFDLGLAHRGVMARSSARTDGGLRALVAWGPERLSKASFVTAEVSRADGFGPSRASERAAVLTQLEFPLGRKLVLRTLASSYRGRFEGAGVLRTDDLEAGRVGFFDATFRGQGGESSRHQALLELRSEGPAHHAAVSSYVVLRDLRLRQNFTGFLLDEDFGDANEQTVETFTLGGRARYLRHEILDVFDLELGLAWRHDRSAQRQQRLRDSDLTPYLTEVDAELRLTDLGLYGELSMDLDEAWLLRAGLRGETLVYAIDNQRLAVVGGPSPRRDALGFHLAPRASVAWRPGHHWEWFLSYGSGFRSPQALSLSDGEPISFTVVQAGELGVSWTPSATLSGTLALFTTYLDEELQFDHATGTTQVTGATLRSGATLLLTARPVLGASLELAATYTYGRNLELESPIAFAPAIVFRAEAEIERSLGRLFGRRLSYFGRTELSFVALKPLPFSETAEPFLLTELSGGLDLDGLSLSVELYNLFDARWRDGEFVYASRFTREAPTSQVPARHFTAGRPLTAQLTLTLEI